MTTCRLPQYFKDPLDFNPERWLGESRKQSHAFSLLPFGYGTRMCTGRRFAELEIYLTAIKLIKNFRLEPVTTKVKLTHAFIVVPDHPTSIKLILG
jgi:cytochrome P450